MSFVKSMGKYISKNKIKKLSGKCSPRMLVGHEKLHDHAKKSATEAVKTASKWEIQKKVEATDD